MIEDYDPLEYILIHIHIHHFQQFQLNDLGKIKMNICIGEDKMTYKSSNV